MRRPNWRCPCRRRKVSVSWMCMALWCILGMQCLTTPCTKCRWAENSEEDFTSTGGWSSQAWKWVHTVLYPKPKASDITDYFLHRWDASLERHDEKKGCWTGEKGKWVCKWQCMRKLSSLALCTCTLFSWIEAQAFISFRTPWTQAFNWDVRLVETGINYY